MHKLKSETWHYLYTDGKDVFISETEPIFNSHIEPMFSKDKRWYHPGWKFLFIHLNKNKYRCIGPPLRINNPENSWKIAEFFTSIKVANIESKGVEEFYNA